MVSVFVTIRPRDNLTTIHATTMIRECEMLGLPAGLDVCMTEAAAGDGSQAPDMADMRAFSQRVNGHVRFVSYWYVTAPGLLNAWRDANLFGMLNRIEVG